MFAEKRLQLKFCVNAALAINGLVDTRAAYSIEDAVLQICKIPRQVTRFPRCSPPHIYTYTHNEILEYSIESRPALEQRRYAVAPCRTVTELILANAVSICVVINIHDSYIMQTRRIIGANICCGR